MTARTPTIAVLGAAGLVGQAVATHLMDAGFPIVAIARRFTAAQRAAFDGCAVEAPIVALSSDALASLLCDRGADIVVNCIGILQESTGTSIADVHQGFVARLLAALESRGDPALLVHLSIPGKDDDDRTPFSVTKRAAERTIAAAGMPFIILRPGFVVASAAYGGSALIRSLAVLPVDLPGREAGSPFSAVDVGDIARSIEMAGRRWGSGERDWKAVWEVMDPDPTTVREVIALFRQHLGGPATRFRLPSWLMTIGARIGDLAALFGWLPPIRTTALREMRRGVTGDSGPWIAATGIEPTPLATMVGRLPATVQEKWFARLYLVKAAVIASLVVFWLASGLIALTVAFEAAAAILIAHDFSPILARSITAVSSLVDIAVGIAIAFRRTCRAGLLAGIAVSVFYMTSAAILTPDMWIEPLGALVKTLPAIILMVVALAILDDR